MSEIPALTVTHSRPWITNEDQKRVLNLLASNMIADGNTVLAFENALRSYVKANRLFCTNSGTQALKAALCAVGTKPGDEVVVPTYVCPSVLDAVKAVEAKPVFCDNGRDWNADAEIAGSCVTSRTRAIVVVHTFGIVQDVAPYKSFGVPIVEDLCQAFDCGKNAGCDRQRGDLAFFSFHPTKCLAAGRTGAVASLREEYSDRLRKVIESMRMFSMPSDVDAALGLAQLRRYGEFQARRRQIAERYLTDLPPSLTSAVYALTGRWCYYRFPLSVPGLDFEEISNAFLRHGVMVRRGVDTLLHRRERLPDVHFPGAVRCFSETLSIPMYPALQEREQHRVIRTVKALLE